MYATIAAWALILFLFFFAFGTFIAAAIPMNAAARLKGYITNRSNKEAD